MHSFRRRNAQTDRGGKKQQNEEKKTKKSKKEQNQGKGTKQGTDKETSNKTKEKGDRESMKWIERRKQFVEAWKTTLIEWIVLKFSTFGRSPPNSVGRAQGP